MDDDIDIEEHDLLDNPRIKSIFPDLSRVKIEIPDDDDIEELYEEAPAVPEFEQEEAQASYHNEQMHYQYDYTFEATTVSDSTEDHQDSEDSAEFENDTYFQNNEIILGTKPAVDYEILYKEAKNSHPVVYLENWEQKLKSNPCFCETCNILFSTVNALDAHRMISHSYLVALDVQQKNTARKSTVTSKYCNHCAKTFPDDTSLIKHLYELLPLNNFPKVSKPEEKLDKGPQFRCLKCKKTFSSYAAGRKHRKIAHPTLTHFDNLIGRIKPKIIKPKIENKSQVEIKDEKKKVKLLSDDGRIFATPSFFPKSTLFQCNVCQIAFISCFSALQHSKYCENGARFSKCGICKRKIRKKDEKIHELQHIYNDKFKIYTIHKSLYEKVLCKCPKCLACFDELFFWSHYKKCDNSGSAYCQDCDVNIALARYDGHRQKHLTKKFTKKDFIIIEFMDLKSMTALKDNEISLWDIKKQRRKEALRKYSPKRGTKRIAEQSDGITLCYCQHCGCCLPRFQFSGHYNGMCKKRFKFRTFCDKCGLCFSRKSITNHRFIHTKQQFTLQDIKILSLMTGEQIDYPITEMFKCRKCQTYFLSQRMVRRHNCKNEKHIPCEICSKKFNLAAFNVHKMFHNLNTGILPELLKKYDSINSTWNIIYMCNACELVTATYDSAVEHSQNHLNNIQNEIPDTCTICKLNIGKKYFFNHQLLHQNNESINRKSFRIFKYNFEDLFKEDWMAFLKLPKHNKGPILSQSVYRYTRVVKMHLERSVPTVNTKFFCMNCKDFIEGEQIQHHVLTKCENVKKIICSICSDTFKSFKQFLLHEGSHETEKKYNIVTFNDEADKEFNKKLLLQLKKMKKPKGVDSVKNKIKVYKCAKCSCCVFFKYSIGRHNDCFPENQRIFCNICNQYFSNRTSFNHKQIHKRKPYLNKDMLSVVYFNGPVKKDKNKTLSVNVKKKKIAVSVKSIAKKINNKIDLPVSPLPKKKQILPTPEKIKRKIASPVSQSAKKEKKHIAVALSQESKIKKESVANLYKCECGLHFTSMKTIQNHLDICRSEVEISKDTCSKCNLVFPTELLVTHLCNHHSKSMKIVIEKVKKVHLIKCGNCLLLFKNTEHFNDHVEDCNPNNGKKCSNCHLNFNKTSFFQHKCSIKDNTTYINKITVMKHCKKITPVYRCEDCDICYLLLKSYQYHVDVNHVSKTQLDTCEHCGLRFTTYSLKNHLRMHYNSNEEYRIKVINPITENSFMITGTNNIKDTKNKDINQCTPKKRKIDEEQNSALHKIPRKSLSSTLMKLRNCHDRKSDAETDTDNEIIVPDNVSDHTFTENVSNADVSQDSEVSDPSEMVVAKLNDSMSYKVKSRIMVHKYTKMLYKCILCNQHFMKDSSFDFHIKRHRNIEENHKCDICFLEFSKHTLPRHKYVHHGCMKLKKEDFIILTETHTNKHSDIVKKRSMGPQEQKGVTEKGVSTKSQDEKVNSDACVKDIKNSIDLSNNASEINKITSEITDDYNKNYSENSDIIQTENEVTEIKSEINEIESESEKLCYFKCADCNVCFINQKTCYNHTKNHETLDDKTYIKCKICDFQFMIDSLKEHMEVHHNEDFRIENLTIEEYKPSGEGDEPKVDIYHAIDKVQSKLVSTTTDVGIV